MLDQVRLKQGWSLGVLVIVAVLSLTTPSAQSTTWYVGTSGTNSTTCGSSSASPCATVSYVLTNRAAAGHTIRVLPGSYTNQGNISFGSTRSNVTLTGDNPANRPEFLNTNITISNGASGVTIANLRIRVASAPFDAFEGGIDVGEYPTLIENNEIWNGAQGVLIRTSQQVTVRGNDIHHMGVPNTDYDGMCILIVNRNNDPVPSGFANAIRLTGNALHDCSGDGMQENSWSEAGVQFNYLIMDNNTIYNNQEQGIDTKGTDDFQIYNNDIFGNGYGGISNNSVYGSTARWEIYNNRLHDHTNFAIFNQGGAASWKIYNNLVYNNVSNPQYNYCAVMLPSDSATVFYGNTVVNNTDSGSLQSCGVADHGNGNNVVNNVFYNNGTGSGDKGNIRNNSGEDGGTPSYNYIYPLSGKTGTNVRSTCMQTGNCPGFVDLVARNFQLLAGSPADNGGTLLASPFNIDLSGVQRVSGNWDLGAYQVGSTTTVPAPGAPVNVRIIR